MTASTVIPLFIRGQDYAPEKSFDIKSPATGKVLHKSAGASVDDAAKAVDAAAEALTSWRRTTPQERQDILLKAGDIMSRRRDELATYMVGETGCASDWADFNLDNSIAMLKDVGGRVPTLASSFPAMANSNRSAIVLREPYGVVLSIAACRHQKINFIGSAAVGRIIAKQAAEHLKPIVLELGGKAPAIVWEDADLDLAAQQCALGSFIHGGQICMCTEKILVHEAIKDTFRQKLAAAVAAIVLINSAAAHKNKQLVADATEPGATILHGDVAAHESSTTRMRPIVVDNVTADMDIYKTESFGPTVSVLDIESEEEAIRIANDTECGLAASVFTQDLRRGLRLAEAIETGAVHINSMTVHDESALPHGGAKSSGYGRFNASLGLEEWTRTKNVTFDR
ncbi:hypothetical protein E4U57_003601 [Claviceps arundinis]|uniref:Aldehyde dehydrogenase domain-containing protein n=1 Tax=Claviceps arundinis TaxID=1623583 RepID=A0A9P7STV2_9HYPO|nr:hypothetical protein E4U57_003601 [Claviceps arundinis]KAG5977202.1 hypothetical protein E4U56_000166 [Claviceps arundinis]